MDNINYFSLFRHAKIIYRVYITKFWICHRKDCFLPMLHHAKDYTSHVVSYVLLQPLCNINPVRRLATIRQNLSTMEILATIILQPEYSGKVGCGILATWVQWKAQLQYPSNLNTVERSTAVSCQPEYSGKVSCRILATWVQWKGQLQYPSNLSTVESSTAVS
jgi:hypothetical protein